MLSILAHTQFHQNEHTPGLQFNPKQCSTLFYISTGIETIAGIRLE